MKKLGQHIIDANENELLEIFILWEQNTPESKKAALVRYASYKGLKNDYALLLNELKQHYKAFLSDQC